MANPTASQPPPYVDLDDVGPDDTMDLEDVEVHPGNPDVKVSLVVPFTGPQLSRLEALAQARGISVIDAVGRLVEEGLERRAAPVP